MSGIKVYEQVGGVASGRRKPPLSEFKELKADHLDMIRLMVFGLDEPGDGLPAHMPLTLVQAADAVGVRRRQAREIAQTDVFLAELNRQVKARAVSEKPRNLQKLMQIRDDDADQSAATKAVQIKAIAAIEGKPEGSTAVNVTVNNQTNVNQVSPGYVIRLDAPQQAGGVVIEGESVDGSD